MKKGLIVFSFVALFLSCGKEDNSISNLLPSEPKAQTDTTKKELNIIKPSDINMAKRAVASWKDDSNYTTKFNFDELYRIGNNKMFSVEYLLKFISFASSNTDGKELYVFTKDDLNKLSISNLKYNATNNSTGYISFKVNYNNIGGANISLPFSKTTYYEQFITLNTSTIDSKYMRGVYENLDLFYTEMLQYDTNKFIALLENKQLNESENTLTLTIKLVSKDKEQKELAYVTKEIKGFKALDELKNDLLIASSSELGTYFGKRFRNSEDGDKLAQIKFLDPRLWIGKAQVSIKKGKNYVGLSVKEVSIANGSSVVSVWTPIEHNGIYADVYLENPRFEVIRAVKENYFLHLTLRLNAVNDVTLNGVEMPLNIHLIQ